MIMCGGGGGIFQGHNTAHYKDRVYRCVYVYVQKSFYGVA